MDVQTKETELVNFDRKDGILVASVPTNKVESSLHWDVALLIVLFALTMVFSQKAMMSMNKNSQQDPAQAAMQKSMGTIMPVMIILTFVFIPIPAGALLYLVTSNIFQIFQTIVINKQLEIEEKDKEESKNAQNNVIDAKVIDTKVINNKDNI